MPTLRIPLAGSYNQRSLDAQTALTMGQDQRFLNCCFEVVKNPITGANTIYVSKRPGWGVASVVEAGAVSTGLIRTDSIGSIVSAFGGTNSTIYDSTISVGVITGIAIHFYETLLSGIGYILIRSSDGTGWYYVADSGNTLAYTADGNNSTTITDIKVAGVASVSGLYVGQKLTAASNIVAGSRIVSINSGSFSAVLDTATTGGAFNDLAITKEPIAKITDADFVTTGVNKSSFTDADGFVFYCAEDGYLYHSDLNSVTAYSVLNRIAVNMAADLPVAVGRVKNFIVCFGRDTTELFFNAGNPTGSVLSRSETHFTRVGVQNQRSIATLEDDIYFVASSTKGDISVRKLLQKEPISTPVVERILGTANAGGAEIYLSAFTMGGSSYLSVAIHTASSNEDSFLLLENDDLLLLENGDSLILEGAAVTSASFLRNLIYNIELNVWSEWDANLATFITGAGTGSQNQIVAASRTSMAGKIYTMNPSADGELHTDDGAAYTMSIRTSKVMFGTNTRKFIKSVRIITDEQLTGSAYLSWSDDDYKTTSTPIAMDLTVANPKVNRCGSFEGGRSFTLTHSSNTGFRAEALEIDYEIGTGG